MRFQCRSLLPTMPPMSRLEDVPKVFRSLGVIGFARRVWDEIGDDHLFAWAAAIAYSWLFAVFPFMIFLMSLMPLLPERMKETARSELRIILESTMPDRAAETIWQNVTEIMDRTRGGLLGIGLLFTLWGASGGMNMTITALERCYEVTQGRPFYQKRPLAVGLTLVVIVLVILLLIVLPIGTITVKWIEARQIAYISSPLFWAWRIMRFPLAVLLMFTVLHVLYHYGPSIKQKTSFFSPGAVFGVTVWLLLALAFRLYVNKFGRYNETYGAVGGVAILLLFFYIDAVVLLIGAEINSEIDFEVLKVPRGSRDFTHVFQKENPDDQMEEVVAHLQPERDEPQI